VLQQTQQLQSAAVDWWDKTANPYISDTYQQLYQIELIKQLDELRSVEVLDNAKKMELMQMDQDRTVPDLSDYFKTFKEIVKSNGYAMECHEIETDDGYLLDVFRIQPKGTSQFGDSIINPSKWTG
jgi:hypothetical protein